MTNTNLGPGGEFDRIRQMLRALGENARGAGDDAALLDVPAGHKLAVSTDTSVENVHFKREWMTFHEIGYRATAAALSDLAAMGASPLGAVIAIAIPPSDTDALNELARGAGEAAAASGTVIVGGDLSSSDILAVTVTVFGSTQRPLLRSGARVGDQLYVTGTLGASHSALTALQNGKKPSAAAREKFVHPTPRIREGLWLAKQGASACIDVSDGALGDLRHVAHASGVHIMVMGQLLPVFEGASIEMALLSGEEYELCATSPGELDTEEFRREFGIPLTLIGHVMASDKPEVTIGMNAMFRELGGFNHFGNDHK